MDSKLPIPANELDRAMGLSDFNIDYTNTENNFKDLARLAASVAGTEISLVNLIDSYTQWTISGHGLDIDQMPREESVCQYTIVEDDHFEVDDLSQDIRFKDKFYVSQDPKLKYYYGIPLKSNGHNLGALCLMDRNIKTLAPEKTELLKIIAEEIVNRLNAYKVIESLRDKVTEVTATQNKVVHDIRGPLGGIIGLAQIISEQGKENNMDEVLEFINMIHKSGNSILELADEILTSENKAVALKGGELNLKTFREKLEKLYIPQARSKTIDLSISISPETDSIPFSKSKLLQITGNLISNAIKFTASSGYVRVKLALARKENSNILKIIVEDSGTGLEQDKINSILSGDSGTTEGTDGEKGYGFGLALVKHLIDGLKGTLKISSNQNGAKFEVELPQ
jgi:signal transduction histidine kinase